MSGLLHTQRESAILDTLSLEGNGGGFFFLSFRTAAKTVTNMLFVFTVIVYLLGHIRENLSLIYDVQGIQSLTPLSWATQNKCIGRINTLKLKEYQYKKQPLMKSARNTVLMYNTFPDQYDHYYCIAHQVEMFSLYLLGNSNIKWIFWCLDDTKYNN